MKKWKAVLTALLLLVPILGFGASADGNAEDEQAVWTQPTLSPRTFLTADSIAAPHAILMEAETGTVLYEKEADTRVAPASVTKVMSLLLIMEAIDRGELQLTDTVVCSPEAARMGGSQIWLEPGEEMTVDDLLKAVAVGSANDATVALAEAIGGTEAGFVQMMNSRAEQLGMNNTCYQNASGLDAESHYTSARDAAIVAAQLLHHPLIINYSTIWMDSLRGGATELVNTNRLVRFYSGITGLKTGTTDDAGCCLTATAERDGLKLIAAVFGADNSDGRFSSARTLLDYGFSNYGYYYPQPLSEPVFLKVDGGVAAEVALTGEAAGGIVLPKGTDSGAFVYRVVTASETVRAPIAAGQQLGSVEIVTPEGETVGSYPLTARHDVERLVWGNAFRMLWEKIGGK